MRAYKKLWAIKRLKNQGAELNDLVDIYMKQVRSVLEFGVPAVVLDIERVQKSFLHIALGHEYLDYQSALRISNLETLSLRRLKLCKKFAEKASKHPKHSKWFVMTKPGLNTRSDKQTYKMPICRLARTSKGPIPYLTNLLNTK